MAQDYRKAHPEIDKDYRKRHYVLKITFTAAEGERLKKTFGANLQQSAKSLIRIEMLRREFLTLN